MGRFRVYQKRTAKLGKGRPQVGTDLRSERDTTGAGRGYHVKNAHEPAAGPWQICCLFV
jgi:hypothetical protein